MKNRIKHNPIARVKLRISSEVLNFIEVQSAKSTRVETGGIIAGNGSLESGGVLITHASDPGPKAVRRYGFFLRDVAYCQSVLDRWVAESGGAVDYIGEWHKHFETEPRPSHQDIETMQNIAASTDYHVSRAVLLIIGRSNSRRSLRTFVANTQGGMEQVEWEEVTGESLQYSPY